MCVAEIIGMLGVMSFPALLPGFITEWQLTNTEAGWINGIYFAGYLTTVPVLVSLTDRASPRKIYYLCLGLTAVSSAGFAFLTDGFWSAMVFRCLAGIGLAGSYMPGLKLLGDHLKLIAGDKDQSRAVAFYTSSFGIGSAISYYYSGVVAEALDWHWVFGLATLSPLVAMAVAAAALPGKDPVHTQAPDTHLLDFRPVLRCRAAMGYVLAYTAHNFELFAFRSWIVAYLVFAAATGPGTSTALSATTIGAVINLLGMPASIFGNELSRRIGRHRSITIVMLSSAVLACIFGLSAAWPFWVVVTLALIYGITVTGDSASITAGVVAAAPEGYRGATMAVHSSIGFMGSFAGPLMFGVALDLASPGGSGAGIGGETVASWGWAFAFSGLIVALGPLALALLRDKQNDELLC